MIFIRSHNRLLLTKLRQRKNLKKTLIKVFLNIKFIISTGACIFAASSCSLGMRGLIESTASVRLVYTVTSCLRFMRNKFTIFHNIQKLEKLKMFVGCESKKHSAIEREKLITRYVFVFRSHCREDAASIKTT